MSIEISLSKEDKQNIFENKVTYVKNFAKILNAYNFDSLIKFIDNYDPKIFHKSADNFFKSPLMIPQVQNQFENFKYFEDVLRKIFNYSLEKGDGVDLYFSFKSGSGETHVDEEDVFLIGLNGLTNYKVFEDNPNYYQIEKGDLLYIPKGFPHKVIALSSRIVLSIGFWGCKKLKLNVS